MERNLTEVGHVCVCVDHTGDVGAGGAESFKYILIDPIVIIVVDVDQRNSFLIEVNLLGHLTKPWQY